MAKITNKQYAVPFILVTSLFFLWGFARSILDVLNKHFQDTLTLTITESALVQVSTYLAYFLMSIPAGMFITRFGYRRGVVFGLMLFAIGAFLFIPSASIGTFAPFLIALFILACGLAFLETSANPYSTVLGPRETSTARLNLSQAFNGLGSCLAPMLVGGFLFRGGSVAYPYVIMGAVVVVVAIVFSLAKLPEVTVPSKAVHEYDAVHSPLKSVFRNRIFVLGAAALLAYEVGEISINSYFIQFTTGQRWLTGEEASTILTGALAFFMIGRFIGSWIMQRVKAETVLFCCAVGTVVCMAIVIFNVPGISLYALIANYVFESIMFPTIFALTLKDMGALTKTASSVLMMTPVGGCAFLLVGFIADNFGYTLPFIIPLVAFCVVLSFAYTIRFLKKD